jgi:hypothetical protein
MDKPKEERLPLGRAGEGQALCGTRRSKLLDLVEGDLPGKRNFSPVRTAGRALRSTIQRWMDYAVQALSCGEGSNPARVIGEQPPEPIVA